MDDDGLWERRKASIPDRELLNRAPSYREEWKEADEERREEMRSEIWESLDGTARTELDALRRFPYSREEFRALPYAERISFCVRPEQHTGPDVSAWAEINAHLGTKASTLQDLVVELGKRSFGQRPKVGDPFCGGGSIPFEAARLGCEAYGSDLNPVAALLTWASLNLVGGGKEIQQQVIAAQETAFRAAEEKVAAWGIERSEEGWQAEAYLYCVEVKPEGCQYHIPLAPSWMIGERTKVIAKLKRKGSDHIDIEIITKPDKASWTAAASGSTGTAIDSRVIDPTNRDRSWPMESLRGPGGLRRWEKNDLVPRPTDVFQERLYCIRWRKPDGTKEYRAPSEFDLKNEQKVLRLLRERLEEWWGEGYLPSMAIPTDGEKTDEPIRTRGWTHWHHLFTPRQLIVNGLIAAEYMSRGRLLAAGMLGIGRVVDWNSKLCIWMSNAANEGGSHVFSNQALNTFYNFSVRPISKLSTAWPLFDRANDLEVTVGKTEPMDARSITVPNHIWITDPPYADAVNYHELADYFLAWYEKLLPKAFPEWIPDGRKALAVQGSGDDFKHGMVDVYANLTKHMPDNGLQLVMFTHQSPGSLGRPRHDPLGIRTQG